MYCISFKEFCVSCMDQAHKLSDYFIGSMVEDDVIKLERMKSRKDVDEGSHHKQAESISSSLVGFL